MVPELDWQNISIEPEDLEFLSSYLLEQETPLGPEELATQLIAQRLSKPAPVPGAAEGLRVYLPKERFTQEERLIFPALKGASGRVAAVRPAATLNGKSFEVIQVEFANNSTREFAASLNQHVLNDPPKPDSSKQNNMAIAQQHAKEDRKSVV